MKYIRDLIIFNNYTKLAKLELHFTQTKSKDHIPSQESGGRSDPKQVVFTFEILNSSTKFVRAAIQFYTEQHKS